MLKDFKNKEVIIVKRFLIFHGDLINPKWELLFSRLWIANKGEKIREINKLMMMKGEKL